MRPGLTGDRLKFGFRLLELSFDGEASHPYYAEDLRHRLDLNVVQFGFAPEQVISHSSREAAVEIYQG